MWKFFLDRKLSQEGTSSHPAKAAGEAWDIWILWDRPNVIIQYIHPSTTFRILPISYHNISGSPAKEQSKIFSIRYVRPLAHNYCKNDVENLVEFSSKRATPYPIWQNA